MKDQRPICPNCKKPLSPNGGTISGSMDSYICWDCNYRLEDLKTDLVVDDKKLTQPNR
jgi:transposase-like protein